MATASVKSKYIPQPASEHLSFVIETGQDDFEVVRFVCLTLSDCADCRDEEIETRQREEPNL